MDYCLGIDTSNYTTSLAAAPSDRGEVVFVRTLLETAPGAVGLRQSDAHFLHTKNLPELSQKLRARLPDGARITSVCVSSRPRPIEGSYMPCFLAGVSAAHLAAAALDVPLYETTHQEGHIAAALYGCPDFPDVPSFYSLHLSGGTMDFLRVEKKCGGYRITPVLSTLDVTAGQLIDRAGVLLGLEFPCGKALDQAACAFRGHRLPRLNLQLKEGGINLSGLQNRVEQYHKEGKTTEEIAYFLFSHIARAIELMYGACEERLPLLLCGGVSASAFLRERLSSENVYFTKALFATDNAVGVSLLGCEKGAMK